MLTPEQIKKLKTDDKLLVQGEFIKAHNNGSILVSLSTKAWESSIHELLFFHPSSLSLPSEHGTSVPTPKHDPCRLFKKGDKVRVVKLNGRTCNLLDLDKEYILASDEDSFGLVAVRKEPGIPINLSFYWLELITPVEELEPYKLIDSPNTYNIVRDSAMVMTIHKKSHPNAKAAAEAERDRLNAEHRKEQK